MLLRFMTQNLVKPRMVLLLPMQSDLVSHYGAVCNIHFSEPLSQYMLGTFSLYSMGSLVFLICLIYTGFRYNESQVVSHKWIYCKRDAVIFVSTQIQVISHSTASLSCACFLQTHPSSLVHSVFFVCSTHVAFLFTNFCFIRLSAFFCTPFPNRMYFNAFASATFVFLGISCSSCYKFF